MAYAKQPARRPCGVGAPEPRWEGRALVTGQARFTGDMKLPGMLCGKLLYAPHAPATIVRIDVSQALRAEGVAAVMTAADIPGSRFYHYAVPDMPILAIDTVRYAGEAVAMVAAESEEQAAAALERIVVEYEPLPGTFDPLEAMAEGARQVQAGRDNVIDHLVIERGDIAQGFTEAAAIVERTYRTQLVEHAFLETESALAVANPDGTVMVYASTQSPHRDRRQIAGVLGLPEARVRVVVPPVGGAFGGKAELHVQPHAALLAWKTRRPVRIVRTREESIRSHIKRHPMIVRYKSGAAADGRLTAIQVQVIGDTGAYTNAGFEVVGFATEMAPGPYQVPNARLEGFTVLTNNPVCGAMRGFGVPQVTFAYEQQMDLLAEQLALDPVEIRLRNALETGSILTTGAAIRQTVGLRETVQEAAKASHWARRAQLERKPAPHLRRGLGLGCCWQGTGFGANIPDYASVQVEMASDGTLLVRCGAADMGQGLSNVIAQIVAGEFTLPLDRVRLIGPDTDLTLDCLASEASRQTYVTGQAASRAARQLRDTLLQAAAQKLECVPADVAFAEGEIVCYRQERSLALPEVIGYAASHNLPLYATGHAQMTTPDPATISYPFAHSNFSCAAQVAQVLVDIETGQVQVERVVAAHDVGRAINPLGVIGQIEGGVVMGLGGALLEDLPYVQDRGLAPSLTEYLIPTAEDIPPVVPVIVEVPDPDGPYGAKGIGEQTMTPTAAAIANAVADALGVRTWTLPMTPERILAALAEK